VAALVGWLVGLLQFLLVGGSAIVLSIATEEIKTGIRKADEFLAFEKLFPSPKPVVIVGTTPAAAGAGGTDISAQRLNVRFPPTYTPLHHVSSI
jgi:hypothetical protein